MQLKIYLSSIWFSGSLCSLIQQKELDASTAASAREILGRHPWGFDLTLGPQPCSEKLTTSTHLNTNDVPNASSFHDIYSGGQTTKGEGLYLGLNQGRNEATCPPRMEKYDTVVQNHGSKKRKMLPVTYSQSYPAMRLIAEKAEEYGCGTQQRLLTPHQEDEQMLGSRRFEKSLFNTKQGRFNQGRQQVVPFFSQGYNPSMTLFSRDSLEFNHSRHSAFKVFNRASHSSISSKKGYEGSDSLESAQQTATPGIIGNNRGEARSIVSQQGEGKGKLLKALGKPDSLEDALQEHGTTQILNRDAEIEKQGFLESKPSRTPVEEKESVANSLIQAHTECQQPVQPFDVRELERNRWVNYKHWFQPNIPFQNAYQKSALVFIFRGLFGREIISKIKAIPSTVDYKYPFTLTSLKQCAKEQSMRGLVSLIEVINSMSDPPLYPNVEKLQEMQRTAVSFVESIWRGLEMEKNHPQGSVFDGDIAFCSVEENSQIKKIIETQHFTFAESNILSNLLLLIWMREYHKNIYEQSHVFMKPYKLKSWIMKSINAKLLSSTSLKEIKAKINQKIDSSISNLCEYKALFVYDIIKPLKIKW